MTANIQQFRSHESQLADTEGQARLEWQDSKGELFFGSIVTPLRQQAQHIEAAMQDLATRLTQIKAEADAI